MYLNGVEKKSGTLDPGKLIDVNEATFYAMGGYVCTEHMASAEVYQRVLTPEEIMEAQEQSKSIHLKNVS